MRAEALVTTPPVRQIIGYFHCSREPEPAEVTFRKGHQLWLFAAFSSQMFFVRAFKQMNMSDNCAGLREPSL